MLNAKGVENARFRTIKIRTPNGEKYVKGELVKNFDPMGKIQIFKYGIKKVCLVEKRTNKVLFQDAAYIFPVKGFIGVYCDSRGKFGILNDWGQMVIEAGVLKNFKIQTNRKNKK